MSTAPAEPSQQAAEETLAVTVTFRSDWGVGTGIGVAGGMNSVVEKDERSFPIVRGTVLAGVLREQSSTAARALDRAATGPWHDFVAALFGSAESPRLVTFSDARTTDGDPCAPVHEVVSLSVDDSTGTAKGDFLRFFERAGACTLRGTVRRAETDLHGRPIVWDREQWEAARLVLTLSGLLVRGIGSNRSDGDGLCDVTIGDDTTVDNSSAKQWCMARLRNLPGGAPKAPSPSLGLAHPVLGGSGETQADPGLVRADLRIRLLTPVVSYEVPFSNEVRSLDFLRGTVLLPWVHGRLRAAFPDDPVVRDAVVSGDLLVSDATAVAHGVRGLPAPFVLTRPKTGRGDAAGPVTMRNMLFDTAQSPEAKSGEARVPVRSGYVFPGLIPGSASGPGTGPSLGSFGCVSLVRRQGTAHDPSTGAARAGQLFVVHALPAGLTMSASITMSRRLHEHLGRRLHEALPQSRPLGARLGSRRLSGTYGQAECRIGPFEQPTSPRTGLDGDGATTLWFTSDVLVRSARLGQGGTLTDLLAALRRRGAAVELAEADGRLAAGIRHRRVDSWSAADQQPRATRLAVSAGSVLRVRPQGGSDPTVAMDALVRLALTGFGELTAQGFGRFVIGHELLGQSDFCLARLRQTDFVPGQQPGASEKRTPR